MHHPSLPYPNFYPDKQGMATKSANCDIARSLKENIFCAEKNKGPALKRRALLLKNAELKGL
ncbi:hypothetical protein HED22_15905 [Thalassospira sp. HF15]|uniref:hypothetical protein n=1 Tax=Thalassospira sp. HF15 TaxID=2722755 RepID=UPI00143220F6|nr:hypothetical protein [Thalassospira sp. HF15]NIY77137.1 hypothetical protein [Thalassospira sp. HF15]